jgi:hypothetical protein
MEFNIGDRVILRISDEEMQNETLEAVDGQPATITEIYQNSYQPQVNRFEVELDHPVKINGQTLRVIPGLYDDNIERESVDQISERVIVRFNQWESLKSTGKKSKI